jgi:pimeloyl-ACP methyl ester carboxylesterase
LFTPSHRGGSGPPLVCLHGFADTWRTWELVLPALERRHDVLALTLAGHAGGPPIEGAIVAARSEDLSRDLHAHQMLAAAVSADAGRALIDHALREGWRVDAERITCPVRVVWGTADRLLPWPSAAARFRDEWLPRADWVVLDGVGHHPQLEVPIETAELILGFTAR